jgi:HD-like signal output (HDOD) protein
MFDFFKRGKKTSPASELRALLGDYELPGFPSVVMEVLSMLRDPEAEGSDIAARVQMDMDMSVKILRLTNSSAFGLSTKVSNVQHAVTILGRSRLESMLLTYAVAAGIPKQMDIMDLNLYWLTAARRACLARHIARRLHAASQADSFTAALLQDLALPLLSEFNGEKYNAVFQTWMADDATDLCALEQDAFGYDHASIGALAAEEWGLSDYLVQSIAGHHDRSVRSPAEPAVRLVSMIRYDRDQDMSPLIAVLYDEFGMESHVTAEMIEMAFEEAEQFAGTFL